MNKRILDLPLYLQGTKTSWCVPYSFLGIAHYYMLPITKKEMIRACRAHKSEGSYTNIELTKRLRKIGLNLKRIKFDYKNIRKTLKNNNPVVVSYLIGNTCAHFSTIIGCWKDNRGIRYCLLNDTYYGKYTIPMAILEYLMYLCGFGLGKWARIVEPIKNFDGIIL